jgi:hypothetical protein
MPQTTGEAALDKVALHRVPGTDLAAYLLASDLAPRLVPGTDLAACLLASTWRRTWCLAPIWPPVC